MIKKGFMKRIDDPNVKLHAAKAICKPRTSK